MQKKKMIAQMNNKQTNITQNRCSGRKYYGKLDVIRGRIAYWRIRWYLQKSSLWDLYYKSSKEQTFKGNKKVSMHIMAGYEAFLSRRNTEEDL